MVCFPSFPNTVIDVIIMIVPTVGYADQLRIMIMNKNPKVYSMNTALILLSVSLIKILFWFFDPFSISLLGQAIFLVIISTLLSYYYFKFLNIENTNNKDQSDQKIQKNFISFIKKYIFIFRTKTFTDYTLSTLLYYGFFIITFFIGCFIIGPKVSSNIASIIANIIDSTVSLPAFKKIVIQKDISTTSAVLIMQYLLGDIMKLIIFKISNSSYPFFLGGFIQLFLDSILSINYAYIIFKQQQNRKELENNEFNNENDFINVPYSDESHITYRRSSDIHVKL